MPTDPWQILVIGYVLSVALETPVLLIGLSPPHSFKLRIFAGFWLTACTYPIVILVLPPLMRSLGGEPYYVPVAETFAPVAECLLFWLATRTPPLPWGYRLRDAVTIIVANLTSFLVGTLLW